MVPVKSDTSHISLFWSHKEIKKKKIKKKHSKFQQRFGRGRVTVYLVVSAKDICIDSVLKSNWIKIISLIPIPSLVSPFRWDIWEMHFACYSAALEMPNKARL